MCEERAYCDSWQLLENIADVELLLFSGVIVEDGEQMVLGAIQERLICLGAHNTLLATLQICPG